MICWAQWPYPYPNPNPSEKARDREREREYLKKKKKKNPNSILKWKQNQRLKLRTIWIISEFCPLKSHSHSWPSHTWPSHFCLIRTVVSFALLSFALLASHWCRSHFCLSHCCRDTTWCMLELQTESLPLWSGRTSTRSTSFHRHSLWPNIQQQSSWSSSNVFLVKKTLLEDKELCCWRSTSKARKNLCKKLLVTGTRKAGQIWSQTASVACSQYKT